MPYSVSICYATSDPSTCLTYNQTVKLTLIGKRFATEKNQNGGDATYFDRVPGEDIILSFVYSAISL